MNCPKLQDLGGSIFPEGSNNIFKEGERTS
jgi:hypothetical protein